jgi:DNA-binding transcriptional LysR family regulator
MELRHLRYFVAIAEERSITRAAERLWIAQPGLSTHMRRLEGELGVKLLERHARGVDLTRAGELFLERARAALAAAELARCTGHNLKAGVEGTIRLGIATEAPSATVPSLLASFGRKHPDVEVTVFESYAGTLVRELRDGRLDAVLGPADFASADLRSVRVASEAWVVLVGRRHQLATRGPVHARDLEGASVVVTGHRDGAWYDRAVGETLAELGVHATLTRGSPGPALYAAVAAGEAVALTTVFAAGRDDVIVRTLEPARRVRFALLCRDATPAPALAELIRSAQTAAQRSPRFARPALASVA